MDLDQYGDPVHAGMTDLELFVIATPQLARDKLLKGPGTGHFYYSGDRRVLASANRNAETATLIANRTTLLTLRAYIVLYAFTLAQVLMSVLAWQSSPR